MNLKTVKSAYFIGIGGIGMSAIARYFLSLGIKVYGYDKTKNAFTSQLEKEGFEIHYEDLKSNIPKSIIENEGLVVYTPAIPSDNKIKNYLENKGIKIYKRAEVLGIISENSYTLAVAGTHGKTTTSSLVAHILNENNINFTAFLGGISTNLKSNYINKTDGININNLPIMVVEADEFDRSFLHLKPNICIVTSTDADHLDIYGEHLEVKKSFQDFVNLLSKDGTAILNEKTELSSENQLIYGKNEKLDVVYKNIQIKESEFVFEYEYNNHKQLVHNGLPGFHNVENATAAITMCIKLGLKLEAIAHSCQTFLGVKRRFEYLVKTEKYIVIDDYAHHPTELESFINSVKEIYPNKPITGIFQPHLYSRTRDFADDFARVLDLLDQCWLMDIYPARELPIQGINSEFLAFKMAKTPLLTNATNILKHLKETKEEVLLIMGAGDIDQLIQPIIDIYNG